MRIVRFMLILAVVIGSLVGPGGVVVAAVEAGDVSCCCETVPAASPARECEDGREGRHCDDDCALTCCRAATAPAEPVVISLMQSGVATRLVLSPPLAHDLSEPGSIFHPPRA